MFLGYQKGKIKFYTEEQLDPVLYNLDKVEETEDEYVLEGDEYVLEGDEYVIKDASWEERERQREAERIAKLSLTKREVFLALLDDKGITPDQVRAMITDEKAKIEFDYAVEYYRFNPLINQIGSLLGYTPEQLDYLFEHKELPQE